MMDDKAAILNDPQKGIAKLQQYVGEFTIGRVMALQFRGLLMDGEIGAPTWDRLMRYYYAWVPLDNNKRQRKIKALEKRLFAANLSWRTFKEGMELLGAKQVHFNVVAITDRKALEGSVMIEIKPDTPVVENA